MYCIGLKQSLRIGTLNGLGVCMGSDVAVCMNTKLLVDTKAQMSTSKRKEENSLRYALNLTLVKFVICI